MSEERLTTGEGEGGGEMKIEMEAREGRDRREVREMRRDEGSKGSGRNVELLRQPRAVPGWNREREREREREPTGPEGQLNTSGQRCDSSLGAARNKQAVGCCQETELPCADFTHAATAVAVIKPAM
ncbi:hypothetical protein VZT92_025629 [Zoarces viviparus]|uniref:Uncharacterized protein n=1 Tax=Zoarces viviparus TaxID=48416 RepID=A0AAW1DXP1_ZOAVI